MEHEKDGKRIFAKDEMELRSVDQDWSREELLGQSGIFFVKDVVRILGIDSAKVKRHVKDLEAKQEVPWDVMGVRKIWNHWIVRMTVFAPYYRRHLIPKVNQIDENWDGNTLLQQKGTYFLTDVCKCIPFTTHQLRYQAKRNPNAKKDYGIWKDRKMNVFLVEMERFAPWVNKLWEGNFSHDG